MKTGCGFQPAIRLSFRGGDSDCRFNKVSSIRSPQALALPMQNFFREAKTKKVSRLSKKLPLTVTFLTTHIRAPHRETNMAPLAGHGCYSYATVR